MLSDHNSEPVLVQIDASFEPLIPPFMANRNREVGTMTEALAQADYETVRKLAHGIKGAGGSYGFDEMSAIAAGLEQAAKAADPAGMQYHLRLLASYLERVRVVYE
ncbi:MAG TPA: Hpt domain-containing protein [Nitrospiraceae bacterium]|jgi:HPt (histidine-containing phosphotransfer) domain-containing protein|nr:Hpt domain-containing protein [Nitrospiraceae bacterium]